LLSAILSVPAAASEISAEEFAMFVDWREGRSDPRLAKLDETSKLKKMAKQMGVSAKALRRAIDKVRPIATTIGKDTEHSIKRALEGTPVSSRVLDIVIDSRDSHVVGYVKWRCGDQRDLEKEAAYIAWSLKEAGGIVKTLGLWCVNSDDTKLFSARIGATAFGKIRRTSIPRFAISRYIRLFEGVKRGPHS